MNVEDAVVDGMQRRAVDRALSLNAQAGGDPFSVAELDALAIGAAAGIEVALNELAATTPEAKK